MGVSPVLYACPCCAVFATHQHWRLWARVLAQPLQLPAQPGGAPTATLQQRLAKEQGFDNELMNMALQSSKETMLDVAHYFDEREAFDKAVQLYQKGGNVPRALDLCFRANLFDDLRVIADDLGEETPPEVLTRCSEFFIEHGQFAKAVHLQITAKRFNDVCPPPLHACLAS